MKTPTPDNDQSMRDALQRDAARVPAPAFDAALHYTTMRRVRALADAKSTTPRLRLAPALAAAGVLALCAIITLWPPEALLRTPRNKPGSPLPPQAAAPRASLLAYQAAANEGEAALFTMLDRDATALLPASSPIFNVTLPGTTAPDL
ncbi:MAG: hypothetical protein WDN28_06360 [Chthoniobacter sp.]